MRLRRKLYERAPVTVRCFACGLRVLAPQVTQTRAWVCALFGIRLAYVCAAIYTNACLSLRAVWHAACICLRRKLYERAPVTVRCLACSLHMLISQVPRTRLGLRAFRYATCVCLCRKLHERVPEFARCLVCGLHMLVLQVLRTRTCDCALLGL